MSSRATERLVTIAVVDDDAAILDSIRLALEFQNWQIHTYLTGEEFLADLSNSAPPDCIIRDSNLTGMSGSEVIHSMSNGLVDVPIIGLTGRPTSQKTKAVIDAGVSTMLTNRLQKNSWSIACGTQ